MSIMKEWQVVQLKEGRWDFARPEEITDYVNAMLPQPNGKRLLAICPNNLFHHWTYGLVARSGAENYVHIDAHPDDTTKNDIDYCLPRSGSFVHYMPKHLDVKTIRMIGPKASWCKTDDKCDHYTEDCRYINDILKIAKIAGLSNGKHVNEAAMEEFFHGIDDIYLSIDLDVVRRYPFQNETSLSKEELDEIVAWLGQHKRIRAADTYFDKVFSVPYNQPELVELLKNTITSF